MKNITTIIPEPDEQGSRWQHPEKQKTLIHTAPVLSPVFVVVPNNSSSGSGSSAGSAIRAIRGRGKDDANKNIKDVSLI